MSATVPVPRRITRENQEKINTLFPRFMEISTEIEGLESKKMELQKQREEIVTSLVSLVEGGSSFEFEGEIYRIVSETSSLVDGDALYSTWLKWLEESPGAYCNWDSFNHEEFAKCRHNATTTKSMLKIKKMT
jgi:flagellar hook-associated protein FlgK